MALLEKRKKEEPKKQPKETVGIRLDPEIVTQLIEIAESKNLSKSELIESAIVEKIQGRTNADILQKYQISQDKIEELKGEIKTIQKLTGKRIQRTKRVKVSLSTKEHKNLKVQSAKMGISMSELMQKVIAIPEIEKLIKYVDQQKPLPKMLNEK